MKRESVVYGLILTFCMAILFPSFAETTPGQNATDILQNAIFADPLPGDMQKDEAISTAEKWVIDQKLCSP